MATNRENKREEKEWGFVPYCHGGNTHAKKNRVGREELIDKKAMGKTWPATMIPDSQNG